MTKKVTDRRVRVAIAGLGNCASALIQAICHYKRMSGLEGLMHETLGGYSVSDIEIVAAFDVDERKVGQDVSEAVFAGPNCTQKICDVPFTNVTVSMGPILDGVAEHMRESFCPANIKTSNVVKILKETRTHVLLNYMPVGSDFATKFYAQCAIDAGCAFVNCMPSFICSVPFWAAKFTEAGFPCIGDDIKSQVGASIINRTLAHLFDSRGCKIDLISQHNRGNNTDFLNMLDIRRLETKFISKKQTVTSDMSQIPGEFDLICNGFDPTLPGDNKVCDLQIKGILCGTPITFNAEMQVVDSYNSAGVVVDAIRVAKLSLDRGLSGPIIPACAYFMKSPPIQMEDNEARRQLEKFINDRVRAILVPHSRIREDASSGEEYSDFWTSICAQASEKAEEFGIDLKFILMKGKYHSGSKFVSNCQIAISILKSYANGYEKILFLPFSVTDTNLKKKLIQILRNCDGIDIYGINVPPDEDYLSEVPGIRGYIGMDEIELGKSLFDELTSRTKVFRVVVIRHEKNNYGLDLRIRGIKERADAEGIDVIVCYAYEHRQIKKFLSMEGTGVITLGIKSTEAILSLKIESPVRMVCVDSSPKIEQLLKKESNKNKVILASFIQAHLYGGYLFSGIMEFPRIVPEKR